MLVGCVFVGRWTDGQTDRLLDEWTSGRMGRWITEWVGECMDGWMVRVLNCILNQSLMNKVIKYLC